MISIKQALEIRDGDYLYDYYGRHLKVFGYSITYENGLPQNVEFSCCDINTNAKFIYQYDELYLNFDDLSDEQKLFLQWLKNQPEYYDDRYETKKLEQSFMSGFSSGYTYKTQQLAESQLQK